MPVALKRQMKEAFAQDTPANETAVAAAVKPRPKKARKIKGEYRKGYVANRVAGCVPKGASRELLEAELARRIAGRVLLNFTTATCPTYEPEWFHEEVAAALDQFLADALAKKSPRLIICAPPQHGKSELVSRRFPAYALGRAPDIRIIGTSYAAELAESFSVSVQRIIESDVYRAIFPETLIAGEFAPTATEKRRADVFEVVGRRGSYRAAGVGGGITGQSADILIVDDPIKDFVQAHSDAYLRTLRNWYGSTAYTRVSSGGGVLVMQTRWHEQDLAGQLLAEMKAGSGDAWRVVNFPAIAEQDDAHRKEGEALAPKRFTLFDLEMKRRALGSYQFAALYQQRPAPAEGGIWKRGWWKFWGDKPGQTKLPERFDTQWHSWDCAFKDTDGSDFVCGGAWGARGAEAFLLDARHARLAFGATVAAVNALSGKWPHALAKLVEDKANGPAVIDSLKRDVSGIIAVNPEGGKVARAHAAAPLLEAGNVYLPDPETHPWVQDLIEECAGFPNGAHDDWVDMVSQALNWWRGSAGGLFAYYRQEAERAAKAIAAEPMASASVGGICPDCGSSESRHSGYVPSTGMEHHECAGCGRIFQVLRV